MPTLIKSISLPQKKIENKEQLQDQFEKQEKNCFDLSKSGDMMLANSGAKPLKG